MDRVSDIGVLDKVVLVLDALAAGPLDHAALTKATGLTRPTAYRLATALEDHRLVTRDERGRFQLGLRLMELGASVRAGLDLRRAARPVMERLARTTGESVQLFVREDDHRVCIEAVESARALRDIVPVGARLPLSAGSGAKILRGEMTRAGWAESVAEREAGVASVSAPVRDEAGETVAAISVSGPVERMTRHPGRVHGAAVVAAATEVSGRLESGAPPDELRAPSRTARRASRSRP